MDVSVDYLCVNVAFVCVCVCVSITHVSVDYLCVNVACVCVCARMRACARMLISYMCVHYLCVCCLPTCCFQVGGIKEKVLAAHRAGLTRVILPARNEKDLHEIPANIKVGSVYVVYGCDVQGLLCNLEGLMCMGVMYKVCCAIWKDLCMGVMYVCCAIWKDCCVCDD